MADGMARSRFSRLAAHLAGDSGGLCDSAVTGFPADAVQGNPDQE